MDLNVTLRSLELIWAKGKRSLEVLGYVTLTVWGSTEEGMQDLRWSEGNDYRSFLLGPLRHRAPILFLIYLYWQRMGG